MSENSFSKYIADYNDIQALYVTFCAFLYQTCTVSGWFVHQWDIRLIELSNFFYVSFDYSGLELNEPTDAC
jgi:hypothetical protein